jgi:hypothetical protein
MADAIAGMAGRTSTASVTTARIDGLPHDESRQATKIAKYVQAPATSATGSRRLVGAAAFSASVTATGVVTPAPWFQRRWGIETYPDIDHAPRFLEHRASALRFLSAVP